MKQLVIFDLDGTLLNTIDDLGNACNHALRILGFPTHGLASYPAMVGNGITRLIWRALPDDARDDRTVAEARRHFIEFYDQHCCDLTRPYPGIPELLDELTRRNVSLAVASNKYQDAVTRIISHYFPDAAFKAVFGNIDGVPTKPDPSVIFEILTACPTPKADTIMVGDSGIDIETARRACIDSVGVTWGFRPERDLRSHYADHIISDPDTLLDIISR